MGDERSIRSRQIVKAAIGVFLRYGYARTTMGDIAQAAGLTRPTLYLSFPDKDSIFQVVVETLVADKLAEIRQGMAARETLHDKLGFACEAWGAEGFDLVRAHPDAKDMFDLGFGAVCAGYGAFEEVLAELVAEPLAAAGLTMTAAELAHVLVFAIKGFKDIARDGVEIRRMITMQVAIVAAALDAGGIIRDRRQGPP
ncbi:MAG TPA: TetR/AcrR family transcriptional regulator [Acetobacteraceae bacterium]|nr:TetR/AcrR family transcriptional regulator [Acetobacteraceae bacterium]